MVNISASSRGSSRAAGNNNNMSMKRILLLSFITISTLGMYLYFRMLKAVNLGMNYQDKNNWDGRPKNIPPPPPKLVKNTLN
eukprot:scaffold12679_cov96-Skeletonema_marinoi.AAC.1